MGGWRSELIFALGTTKQTRKGTRWTREEEQKNGHNVVVVSLVDGKRTRNGGSGRNFPISSVVIECPNGQSVGGGKLKSDHQCPRFD